MKKYEERRTAFYKNQEHKPGFHQEFFMEESPCLPLTKEECDIINYENKALSIVNGFEVNPYHIKNKELHKFLKSCKAPKLTDEICQGSPKICKECPIPPEIKKICLNFKE